MKKIYTTKNYDLFKSLIDNREVKTRTTSRIIESIKNVGYITNPIICNEKMEIIDGQNRLEALKELDMPVDYIIEEGIGIEHCRALNINQSNWSTMDWIKSYADGGNTSYQYLINLIKAYPDMKLRVIAFAITGGIVNGAEFKNGDMKCNADQYNQAIAKLNWLRSVIKPISNLDGNRWIVECAAIWAYSDPEVDNAILIEKIAKYYSIATPVSGIDSALEQMEKIYNYRNKNKVYLKTNYLKSLDKSVTNRRNRQKTYTRSNTQRQLDLNMRR